MLHERYAGKVVSAVEVGRPTFYRRPPRAAVEALRGATISGFSRKGKYMTADLVGRPGVVFHLGMSGRITVGGESPHVRFRMVIGGDAVLFHDARRFGRVGGPVPELGPEPLDPSFDAACLRGVLRGRTAPVKALIMDQGLVAGLGNIYATEALHQARVRPGRAGRSLSLAETERLAEACRDVLRRGVEAGGATLEDESFLDPLGRPGRMQMGVRVYGRDACGTCSGPVLDTRRDIGGRASRYCPSCQR